MIIIGSDLHTRYQQIALLDTETGETVERRLEHENGEARSFYESLPPGARVGMEATVQALWFERLLTGTSEGVRAWDSASERLRNT
jgi:hypothetical protein